MSKKRVWSIIGLLVLMWASSAGQYMNLIETYDYGKCCLAGLIDVVIITIIMMIIPFIFRLMNKERLDYVNGKKICKWNSWGMFALSILLTVIIMDGNGMIGIGGLGALIFYYINKWLFVYDPSVTTKLKRRNNQIKDDIESNYEDTADDETIDEKKNKKIIYCKTCGGRLDINNKCKKCGKQYLNFKKIFPYIILAIMIIIIAILVVKNINYKKEIDNLSNQNWVVENYNEEYLEYWQDNHNKVDFIDENIVFVIEGYGDYYYSYNCMMNKVGTEEYSYWAYNKEQAISRGYSAGRCN